MDTSILDRPCKRCGVSPAEYERTRSGHRRVCVKCRAAYRAQVLANLKEQYKPRPGRNPHLRAVLVKRCTQCEEVKRIDDFYYSDKSEDKRQSRCKKCSDTARALRKQRNPNHHIGQRVRMERFKAKLAPYRTLVYEHYGNACHCCGESMVEFLTIDHMNNDGSERRRKNRGNTGAFFFREIVEQGFPDDLRLSCYNCNCGRARMPGKICPHEQRRAELLAA